MADKRECTNGRSPGEDFTKCRDLDCDGSCPEYGDGKWRLLFSVVVCTIFFGLGGLFVSYGITEWRVRQLPLNNTTWYNIIQENSPTGYSVRTLSISNRGLISPRWAVAGRGPHGYQMLNDDRFEVGSRRALQFHRTGNEGVLQRDDEGNAISITFTIARQNRYVQPVWWSTYDLARAAFDEESRLISIEESRVIEDTITGATLQASPTSIKLEHERSGSDILVTTSRGEALRIPSVNPGEGRFRFTYKEVYVSYFNFTGDITSITN